jgi:hypothetical protein
LVPLAGNPFVVGREADPDGFHTARGSQVDGNRPARVKNWSFHWFDPFYWQMASTLHFATAVMMPLVVS